MFRFLLKSLKTKPYLQTYLRFLISFNINDKLKYRQTMISSLPLLCLMLITGWDFAFAAYKGRVTYGNYNYLYYDGGHDYSSWCVANVACWKQFPSGMELAMLKSEGINTAVTDLLSVYSHPRVWVGASDIYDDNYWIWNDGTPLSYTNWAPGEPNGGGQVCMKLNWPSASTWDDSGCGNGYGHVCQLATTNAVRSDFSDLTVRDETTSTFWAAKKQCESVGARLVQINDEMSMEAILKKLDRMRVDLGNTQHWVDGGIVSGCSVLRRDGFEERECDGEGFRFICETAPPNSLKVSSEHEVVAESDNVDIKCSASGIPLPEVAWYRNGKFVPGQSIGTANSTMTIKKAVKSDAGRYICIAKNIINGEEMIAMGISVIAVTTA